jgi:hypothetical protein
LNNGVYKNHIPHVAQMFLNTEKDGYKIASNILADYVLIYVVAHRISVNDNDRNNTSVSYYALGDGGYESLIYWFSKIGRFDERKYLEQDKFTPTIKFWDTTLLGKLIPFTLRGYIAHNSVPHITDNLIKQQYTPGSLAIYSKHVKYPINSTISSDRQPFSLVYSSTSFTESNQDIISAVFLYKINRNYK